ncbi:MAG: cytochrome c oxidase assembly protein [Chloroflexi bacterium]|nr:MAG: cytochrome c oxidase assembly protein [Chloroflexota bacterium]
MEFSMFGLSLSWPWHPGTFVVLLMLAILYLIGLGRVRARQERVEVWRIIAFFAGLLMAALFLLTPIDTIARTQLFSVHMAQVVTLVTLCAPLLLFGSPAVLLRPLVELPLIRAIVRFLTFPLTATLLFNISFVFWHLPLIYDRVVTDPTLYSVAVLSIFLASLLNWWPLIGSLHELRRMSYPVQLLYVFLDGQPVDIYALVLVFSMVPLYANSTIPSQIGLSRFADQAVGGVLLLIPGLVDLAVMTPLFFRWLGLIEQKAKLDDERRQEEMALEEAWEEEDAEV